MRCVRLFTDVNGMTHAQEGRLDLQTAERGDLTTAKIPAKGIFFKQTSAGQQGHWHSDLHRQFVVTLQGCLLFETQAGEQFELNVGDVLFTEEAGHQGHRWRIIGNEPWQRAYIILPKDVQLPFQATNEKKMNSL